MNTQHIDAIAKAVLYEGYMLYPYRPSSVKNRQRFNFGVLYPRPYSEAQSGSDAWSIQTECLVRGDSVSTVEIRLRFLKLIARSVRATEAAVERQSVSAIDGDGNLVVTWQEAIECEVTLPVCKLEGLVATPVEWRFPFPAKEVTEPLRRANGTVAGIVTRKQESVRGVVEGKVFPVTEGVFRLQVRVKNLTPFDGMGTEATRDSALMRSLVSAHVLLGVADGEFVSLLEPPEELRDLAASCQNVGVWPVLVGAEGQRDTMLASPIILYDYPQIAPESPGDLFDGTEIDAILALRILTMTDDEKQEMRQTDERARKMLERTEALSMEALAKLHGTLRELRPSFPSARNEPARFEPARSAPARKEMP
jgi:hypothetical protein